MEAHTTCAICNHSYNSAAKKPLVLPCSHSFCQDCLELMEAEGKKCCFSCSVTWKDVKISDLLPCYQQIPAKEGEEGAYEASLNGTCGEHDDEYIFWCKTCDLPMCKKCLRLKHNGCQFVLMDEKEEILQEQHEAELSLLKEKITKYCAYTIENKENLAFVQALVEELQSLGRKLLEWQTNLNAWQIKAQKKLSEPVKRPRALLKLPKQQDSEEIEVLERKIRNRPLSLLLHVAASYQSSLKDVRAFVSVLQSRVEARRTDGPSCDENLADRPRDLVIREAVTALTDGGHWVVSDAVSVAAVQRVLQTTSIRPAKVEIASKNIPDGSLIELLTLLEHYKKYPVHFRYEPLACFPHSTAPGVETRTSTTARLNACSRSAGWNLLCQFWGHLDAPAVQKLPATISNVGLMLIDQQDMAAVDALHKVAFTLNNGSIQLIWSRWRTLDLLVATSFQPDYWKLSWTSQSYCRRKDSYSPMPVTLFGLSFLGIHFRLHLPQLVQGDMRWMGDLFRAIGQGTSQNLVSLLLPDARIDPDILLGVLRDCAQRWDVHLPASLPQLVPRKEMVERYKKYGHKVTWDLE